MGAVATPYGCNMDAISAKDVFPASIASHDISPIWLHEYIALPGPLRIVECCAYRPSFCLSYARMRASTTVGLSVRWALLPWLFTHSVRSSTCP